MCVAPFWVQIACLGPLSGVQCQCVPRELSPGLAQAVLDLLSPPVRFLLQIFINIYLILFLYGNLSLVEWLECHVTQYLQSNAELS